MAAITSVRLAAFTGIRTFVTEVHVTADNAGIITITGGEGIVTLAQYCPDELADGCDPTITITRNGNSFVLDKEGLAHHQVVFNFRDSSGKWLRIPNKAKMTCGANANVTCETDRSYFTYTGAAAAKK